MAPTEDIAADPVDEGKLMAGLISMVRAREIPEIPTGGGALYARLGGKQAPLRLRPHRGSDPHSVDRCGGTINP